MSSRIDAMNDKINTYISTGISIIALIIQREIMRLIRNTSLFPKANHHKQRVSSHTDIYNDSTSLCKKLVSRTYFTKHNRRNLCLLRIFVRMHFQRQFQISNSDRPMFDVVVSAYF